MARLSQRIAVIATLAAIGTAAKVALAWAPNIELVMLMVICSGIVFGAHVGASVGLISNVAADMMGLGIGLHTTYVAGSYALIGVLSGAFGRLIHNPRWLELVLMGFWMTLLFQVIACVGWAYTVGLTIWVSFMSAMFLPPFMFFTHIVGNTVILCMLGPRTVKLFRRYRERTGW